LTITLTLTLNPTITDEDEKKMKLDGPMRKNFFEKRREIVDEAAWGQPMG
jgi:hypothetical protein